MAKWNTGQHGVKDAKRTKEMVKLYRQGNSIRALAEYFGISHARVHQILRQHAAAILKERGRRVRYAFGLTS